MTRERDSEQRITQAPAVGAPDLGDRIRLVLGLAGGILLIVLLVQNLESTTIDFLFWSWDIPLVFALVASALLGALAWGIVGFFRHRAQDAALRTQVRAERERERTKK